MIHFEVCSLIGFLVLIAVVAFLYGMGRLLYLVNDKIQWAEELDLEYDSNLLVIGIGLVGVAIVAVAFGLAYEIGQHLIELYHHLSKS